MKLLLLWLFAFVSESCFAQAWERVQLCPLTSNNSMLGGICFGDTCIVAEGSGFFFNTNNFFQSYSVDSMHQGITLQAFSFPTRRVGFVTSTHAQGGILTTIDGGQTWNELNNGIYPTSPGDVLYFRNQDTGYVAYSSYLGRFRHTWNGGLLWSNPPILNLECRSILRIQFTNDSTGYLLCSEGSDPSNAGYDYHLYKSEDYGITWNDYKLFSFPEYRWSFVDFDFLDDSTVILVADKTIFKSTDGGLSYNTVMASNYNTDYLSRHISSIAFVSHNTGFAAFEASVYKTNDAGSTWIRTNFGFDSVDIGNSIMFITATSSNRIVVGCQKGNIYKTETGGGVWSDVKDVKAENALSLYPNPTNDKLHCSVTHVALNSTIQITTIEGKVILTGIPVTQPNFEIDVSALPAGIYFLQLSDERQRVVRKFVKQ